MLKWKCQKVCYVKVPFLLVWIWNICLAFSSVVLVIDVKRHANITILSSKPRLTLFWIPYCQFSFEAMSVLDVFIWYYDVQGWTCCSLLRWREGWIFYKILQEMLGNAEQCWQHCWTRCTVILHKNKDLAILATDKQKNKQTNKNRFLEMPLATSGIKNNKASTINFEFICNINTTCLQFW